jgi:hypothetical protein
MEHPGRWPWNWRLLERQRGAEALLVILGDFPNNQFVVAAVSMKRQGKGRKIINATRISLQRRRLT